MRREWRATQCSPDHPGVPNGIYNGFFSSSDNRNSFCLVGDNASRNTFPNNARIESTLAAGIKIAHSSDLRDFTLKDYASWEIRISTDASRFLIPITASDTKRSTGLNPLKQGRDLDTFRRVAELAHVLRHRFWPREPRPQDRRINDLFALFAGRERPYSSRSPAGANVIDPFAGSCVTGEVCERLKRRWRCIDTSENYLHGALGRFKAPRSEEPLDPDNERYYYKAPRPGILWNGNREEPLPKDGGPKRRISSQAKANQTARTRPGSLF